MPGASHKLVGLCPRLLGPVLGFREAAPEERERRKRPPFSRMPLLSTTRLPLGSPSAGLAQSRRLTWRDAPVPTGPPAPPGPTWDSRARARREDTHAPRALSTQSTHAHHGCRPSPYPPIPELVVPLRPTRPGPQTLSRARPIDILHQGPPAASSSLAEHRKPG